MALAPRPYQIAGRDFLAERTRALLADEMRVGKTPQAIMAAEKRGAKKALVLCPAIAVPHWHGEWMKWAPVSRIETDVMSYDMARNMWKTRNLEDESWDVMIVDEAHFAKNPEAIRTQMVYGKGGLGYQVECIWSLSGTPATKHAGELWPMLRAFGATDMTYTQFRDKYCTGYFDMQRREFRITGTREKYVPELRAMLAPLMLRRTRKEVAPEMPDIQFNFLEVTPDKRVDIHPTDLSWLNDDDLLSWVESQANSDTTNRQAVALAKVKPLVDEIEFAIGTSLLRQTVVFGWHKEPLQVLAHQLCKRGVVAEVINGDTSPKRKELVQDHFRSGVTQVICANIMTAGTAIDLSAASHGYFLELDWVPGNNEQAANRLVNLQTGEPVTIDVATWPGTIDDRIQRVLMRRAREIKQLI